MALKHLSLIIATGILMVFSGCKKEDTAPSTPAKCSDFEMALANTGTNPMDSVHLVVEEYYNNTKQTFDSTFINPPNGFSFKKEFCGDYLFKIDFYHQQTTLGWEANVNIDGKPLSPIKVNGFTTAESAYLFSK